MVYTWCMGTIPFGKILASLPIEILLFGIFALSAIVFSIYSGILFWHWRAYSTGKFTTMGNLLMFVCVGVGLLFIMLFSALWYSAV